MSPRPLLAFVLLLAACGDRPSPASTMCGVALVAGPTLILEQFGVPGQTLAEPPSDLPPRLVARVVAGPALPAVVGRADSLVVIGVEGRVPETTKPGYGVLVVDKSDRTLGVVLYEGAPVEGAPQIGTVQVGSQTLPLLGVQTDPERFADARCPLFPDSVLG